MKIWEAPVPSPFHGLWRALTNTNTCSAGCQVGFKPASTHGRTCIWQSCYVFSVRSCSLCTGKDKPCSGFWEPFMVMPSLFVSDKGCSVSCCDQPCELVVNFMQKEEFCFRVHNCSLCSCELLALVFM